jgi:hypothetical protein
VTEENARRIANVVMAAAVVGAAYYVVRTPPLRRTAWKLLVVAVTGALPAWIGAEVRQAWAGSGAGRPHDMMGG